MTTQAALIIFGNGKLGVPDKIAVVPAVATDYHTEWIDGIEVPKPLPKKLHARVQTFLIVFFSRALPKHYEVLSELNVLCGRDRLVPDVMVAAREAQYRDGDLADPPLLAVEILSPGQTLGNLFDKSRRLRNAGAPLCWIIWPEERKAWMHMGSDPVLVSETLSVALPGGESLELPLRDIWAELD